MTPPPPHPPVMTFFLNNFGLPSTALVLLSATPSNMHMEPKLSYFITQAVYYLIRKAFIGLPFKEENYIYVYVCIWVNMSQ